jgi:CTP:phosphocholine cytidylyltransferase-like protein
MAEAFNSSEREVSHERYIFDNIFKFLTDIQKKSCGCNNCGSLDEWRLFERAISTFYLDEKVSRPEVFELLRKFVYPTDFNYYGKLYNFMKALDTLNDNDILMIALQLQTKLFHNSFPAFPEITDFIPVKIVDYLLKRISISFQSELA